MTRIYFYVAIAAVLAFLCVAVIVLLKIIGMKNVEIKALSESVKQQDRSIGVLLKHSNELAEETERIITIRDGSVIGERKGEWKC